MIGRISNRIVVQKSAWIELRLRILLDVFVSGSSWPTFPGSQGQRRSLVFSRRNLLNLTWLEAGDAMAEDCAQDRSRREPAL